MPRSGARRRRCAARSSPHAHRHEADARGIHLGTRVQKIESRRSGRLVVGTARNAPKAERLSLSRPIHAERADAALHEGKRAPQDGDLLGAVQSVEKGDVRVAAGRVPGRNQIRRQRALLVGNLHALKPGDAVRHPLLVVGEEFSVGRRLSRIVGMDEALARVAINRASHVGRHRGLRVAPALLLLGERQCLVRHPAPGVMPGVGVSRAPAQPLSDLIQLLEVRASHGGDVDLPAHQLRPQIMLGEISKPGTDDVFRRHEYPLTSRSPRACSLFRDMETIHATRARSQGKRDPREKNALYALTPDSHP